MKTTLAPKPIWKLRQCPRCLHGDLYIGAGTEVCLQCGYTRDLVKLRIKSQPLTLTGRLRAEGSHRKEVVDE